MSMFLYLLAYKYYATIANNQNLKYQPTKSADYKLNQNISSFISKKIFLSFKH